MLIHLIENFMIVVGIPGKYQSTTITITITTYKNSSHLLNSPKRFLMHVIYHTVDIGFALRTLFI